MRKQNLKRKEGRNSSSKFVPQGTNFDRFKTSLSRFASKISPLAQATVILHESNCVFFAIYNKHLINRAKSVCMELGDKAKAREILSSPNAVEYMSSEESDPGDMTEERSRGPKPRKIRKLSWERSKLKNIKEILDGCYLSGLNAKRRRTTARISRCEEVSPRPCPVSGPSWAVRSQ